MTRFLVVLAILMLLWVALQRAIHAFLATPQGRQLVALWRALNVASGGAAPRGEAARRSDVGGRQSQLVRCSQCGTHVPADRVLRLPGSGEVVCSEECRRRASAR